MFLDSTCNAISYQIDDYMSISVTNVCSFERSKHKLK